MSALSPGGLRSTGRSRPDRRTGIGAAICKHEDGALGNVVGSHILGILGITALIKPIDMPAEIARVEIGVMLCVTALLLVRLRSGRRLSRIEGALLLALNGGYSAFLALRLSAYFRRFSRGSTGSASGAAEPDAFQSHFNEMFAGDCLAGTAG